MKNIPLWLELTRLEKCLVIFDILAVFFLFFTIARADPLNLWQDSGSDLYFSSGTVSIGTSTSAGIFNVASTKQGLTVLANGNVGIGITTPSQQLSLTGNLQLPATTATAGAIYQGNSLLIHSYGTDNFFVGLNAGNLSLTGTLNLAVGSNAGSSLTNGNQNLFIGSDTGKSMTGGYWNIFIGADVAPNAYGDGISGNVVIGNQSMMDTGTNAYNNTYIGYDAGRATWTNSFDNTFIGSGAGRNVQFGHDNVFIGYQAGYNESGSNKLYISNSNTASPLIYGDFGTSVLAINGNVGIGTTTPGSKLTVSGDIDFTGDLFRNGILFASSTSGLLPAGGTPGQVLTLNASGTPEWMTPSAGCVTGTTTVEGMSNLLKFAFYQVSLLILVFAVNLVDLVRRYLPF